MYYLLKIKSFDLKYQIKEACNLYNYGKLPSVTDPTFARVQM